MEDNNYAYVADAMYMTRDCHNSTDAVAFSKAFAMRHGKHERCEKTIMDINRLP